ncbi:hypothetical protein B0H12DRAFT_1111680 [Mycena haematopus]|nr:hypothetical protein B0H12DRAFT_1111680 [Mycena haematopus]
MGMYTVHQLGSTPDILVFIGLHGIPTDCGSRGCALEICRGYPLLIHRHTGSIGPHRQLVYQARACLFKKKGILRLDSSVMLNHDRCRIIQEIFDVNVIGTNSCGDGDLSSSPATQLSQHFLWPPSRLDYPVLRVLRQFLQIPPMPRDMLRSIFSP